MRCSLLLLTVHIFVTFLVSDNKYWNEGYVVSTPHTLTPHFLTPHTHTIITAGKALNLLRLCKPNVSELINFIETGGISLFPLIQHPLCVGVFSPPKVFVALSSTQLNDIYTQCQEYRSKVIEHTKMSEQLRQAQVCVLVCVCVCVCTIYRLPPSYN